MTTLPESTFELRISFPAGTSSGSLPEEKSALIAWLEQNYPEGYVEGSVDDVDVENEYGVDLVDTYENLGGNLSPISIFKYDRDHIAELQRIISQTFSTGIQCEILTHSTQEWTEGWKQSFKPITAGNFYIYPPWEKPPADISATGLVAIEIEPGMAFGTGQHATTTLCLEAFTELIGPNLRIADIGTGTGILSIAAAKSKGSRIVATDIDPDAVTAARANAIVNGVNMEILRGSADILGQEKFDIVFANILAHVLLVIMPDLAKLVDHDGYLILSGILPEQDEEIIARASQQALTFKRAIHREGWSCVIMHRLANQSL